VWLGQWIVPGANGSEPAELVIWSPDTPASEFATINVPQWEREFRSGVIPIRATVDHRTIGGMDTDVVELAGEYTGMGGGWHRPDFRQLTAIVDSPEGTIVIRLLGPSATVEAHHQAFDRMINGLRTTR
jgi:hypothetical protein